MTQQYLVGELSQRLGQLQDVAAEHDDDRYVATLRHEVETAQLCALHSLAVRSLELSDQLCWDSLSRGDITAFDREAAICAELCEFCMCAGLLEPGSP
jgi:hypothetical protein